MTKRSKAKNFWSDLEVALKKGLSYERFDWARMKVSSEELPQVVETLCSDWGFFFLLDIWASDHLDDDQENCRFLVHYELLNLENSLKVEVVVELMNEQKLVSLGSQWSGAYWYQNEITEMFGIDFTFRRNEKASTRALLLEGVDTKYPLRKNSFVQNELKRLHTPSSAKSNMKSVSSRSLGLGPLRFQYSLKEGLIDEIKLNAGLSHKGLEKLSEQHSYEATLGLLERISPLSAPSLSFGLCRLLEDGLKLAVPDRAKVIRMLVLELARVLDHLSCLKAMADDADHHRLKEVCTDLIENVLIFQRQVFSRRVLTRMMSIGGVRLDLESGWSGYFNYLLEALDQGVDEISVLTRRSRLWMKRTNLFPIHAKLALDWGMTGPNLRATGVNYDLRKINPFYFYKDVDFEIPLGINGDAYDRCLVRTEEMRQSIKILYQLTDNLPTGPISCFDLRLDEQKQTNLSLIKNLQSFTPNYELPLGSYSAEIEGGNGVFSYKVLSNGGPFPHRFRLRTPSFSHAQFMEFHGRDLSPVEFYSLISSLHIVSAEVDR